jgi:prepilin peptidase CpaA
MIAIALEFLLIAVLPALLIASAVWDLASFTIPNALTGTITFLFLAFVLATSASGHAMHWHDVEWHLAAGLLGLVAGIALFGFGWIGGGDAKLFAAVSLWLGWNAMLDFAILASVFGGFLTMSVLALRKSALPHFFNSQEWLSRLAEQDAGVPYGVALAAAALVTLPNTGLFGFAVG